MGINACGQTDTGCVRAENEDRILVDTSLGLFLVCDGMGGHQHGEIAAELAVAAIKYSIDASRDRLDVSWPFGYDFDLSLDANRLITAIHLANRHVWRRAEQNLECAGMGTTIAAALLIDGVAVIGNVGDSRIYLYRKGELTQVTSDDTMIATLLKKGMLSPGDAAAHPMRNVLTQAIGSQENVEVHLQEEGLQAGDIFLLCSDGLHGVIGAAAIRSILGGGDTLENGANRLISAARAAGAPDNVSAVLLQYS
jgi:PPM family protein phosphatase